LEPVDDLHDHFNGAIDKRRAPANNWAL